MPYVDVDRRREAGKEAAARWRARHPERKRASAERCRRKRLDALWALKARPCADCSVQYPPEAMDFDHTDGNKLFTISGRVSSTSMARLLAEAAKCEVVCSNCHRMRTFSRGRNQ